MTVSVVQDLYFRFPAKGAEGGPERQCGLFAVFIFLIFLLVANGKAEGKEALTLGRIEKVILLPWAIELPARIDTGATVSSLDARAMRVHGERVEFTLPEKYGASKLELPILGWHHVRSPHGKQKRPVVEMELCIGPKRIRAKVNLTDRSMVKYPLILGRNILREGFVVDVKRSRILPPKCEVKVPPPASN